MPRPRHGGRHSNDERASAESTASSADRPRLSSGYRVGMATEKEILQIAGREVTVTNPRKVYFPETGHTKLDLVQYYLAVADGALRGAGGRPMALKRFVDGAAGQPFFQKRAPENLPEFIRTATLTFPSGRTADEVVIDDAAGLAWVANLGCIDLNPHPVRAEDLDHPDELRVDLDPVPGVPWDHIRLVALAAREALEAVGLVGWPKTSGSRGIHINVRIEPRWTFPEVRRAALALARDVERRVPDLATSKWWKEERHGVFLDYNQNAKDRTVASAYSVRPLPDARVSDAADLGRGPDRRGRGVHDRHGPGTLRRDRRPGGRDRRAPSARSTRCWSSSERHESEGLGDAPWPPNYAKQAGEPPRVQPSKARRPPTEYEPGRGEAGGPPPDVAAERAAAVAAGDPNAGSADRVGRLASDPDRPAQVGDPGRGDRPRRAQGRGAGRASSAGRRAIRRSSGSWSRPTSSSIRCAGGPRPGRASGSTSSTCRRPIARPRNRSNRISTHGRGWTSRRGRPRRRARGPDDRPRSRRRPPRSRRREPPRASEADKPKPPTTSSEHRDRRHRSRPALDAGRRRGRGSGVLRRDPRPARGGQAGRLAGRGGCWFAGPGVAIHLGVEADSRPSPKPIPRCSSATFRDPPGPCRGRRRHRRGRQRPADPALLRQRPVRQPDRTGRRRDAGFSVG